jgi:hypothetical protein
MFATTKLPCLASPVGCGLYVHTVRGLVGLASYEWPIAFAVAGAVRPAASWPLSSFVGHALLQ